NLAHSERYERGHAQRETDRSRSGHAQRETDRSRSGHAQRGTDRSGSGHAQRGTDRSALVAGGDEAADQPYLGLALGALLVGEAASGGRGEQSLGLHHG